MAVTLHAILLIVIPIVTAIICIVGPRRLPPKPAHAAIIAGASALLVFILSAHLCDAGDPFTQCIIIGVSVWFLQTYSASKVMRGGLSTAMVAIMFALSIQYGTLVHSRTWYGHPYPPAVSRVISNSRLSSIRTKLKEQQFDGVEHSEGWLREMPFAANLEKELEGKPFRFEVGRAWHTWFTRLFPMKRIEQDLWFAGGRLPETADAVTIRDVP